ncbi:porin [Chitinimonas sp. BJYL2]|uniref:porin n=1 Tax=Chitinimonas sp. BJYL2 TaxID=2976696 RepID=UPI0022B36994|nr:porin [Chitinimonas sp. BJYL2]
MSNRILTAAVLAALAAPVLANDNNVTLYGRADVGVESNDDGKTSRFVVQSLASRIGFKGEENLGDGLKAIWQVESTVGFDDSANSGNFASRNSFVGLRGDFGSVIAGNTDTPFKLLAKGVDLLWNQADPLEHVTHGKASGLNVHTRQTNTVQYHSPNWDGFQFKLGYSPDENKGTYTGATAGSRRDTLSGSAEYATKTWNVGAAYDRKNEPTARGADLTAIKLIGSIKLDQLTLGAAWSKLDNGASGAAEKSVDTWTLQAAYALGKTTLRAAVAQADESAGNARDGVDFYSAQIDYALSKRSTVYAYYAAIQNEANARARFDYGSNKFTPLAGNDPRVLGVAIRHNF